MAALTDGPAAKLSAFAADIDELLLLMRLSDVSELAPVVLAVHPNVYRPDDQLVVDLAVLPGLIDAGLVDATGSVDPQVGQWLRALQAPAAEVAIRVFDGDAVLRGASCGGRSWWSSPSATTTSSPSRASGPTARTSNRR